VGLGQQRGSATHLPFALTTQPRAAGAPWRGLRKLDPLPDRPVLPTCCAVKAPPASAERPRPPIQVRRSRAIVHEAATFRAGPAHRRGRSCAFGKTTSSTSWTLFEPGSWPPVFRFSCREEHTNQQSERGFRSCRLVCGLPEDIATRPRARNWMPVRLPGSSRRQPARRSRRRPEPGCACVDHHDRPLRRSKTRSSQGLSRPRTSLRQARLPALW
jgi:hypothetical protein